MMVKRRIKLQTNTHTYTQFAITVWPVSHWISAVCRVR